MSHDGQVCWEKLTNYFEIEPKYVNMTPDCYVATPEKLAAACDENTIGVAAVFGTTYTGAFEDVQGLDKAIGELVVDMPASQECFADGLQAWTPHILTTS